MRTYKQHTAPGSAGFSLLELTVAVVVLGVLSMMAVPRYQAAIERTRAAEAFTYLSQVEGAQERHNARTGEYAKSTKQLNMKMDAPKRFHVGTFSSYDWQTQWELRLTRQSASSGPGNYTVTWNQNGFIRGRSSIKTDLLPML